MRLKWIKFHENKGNCLFGKKNVIQLMIGWDVDMLKAIHNTNWQIKSNYLMRQVPVHCYCSNFYYFKKKTIFFFHFWNKYYSVYSNIFSRLFTQTIFVKCHRMFVACASHVFAIDSRNGIFCGRFESIISAFPFCGNGREFRTNLLKQFLVSFCVIFCFWIFENENLTR